jgi:hypothetical protein
MNTALSRLRDAIQNEKAGGRAIQSFTFRYNEHVIAYMGRFYAYVYEGSRDNTATEDEYGWDSYEEMLNETILETEKSIGAMLSELPAHDLEIDFDVIPNDDRFAEPNVCRTRTRSRAGFSSASTPVQTRRCR